MSAIPGRIDNRMITADGLNDYHKKFLYALPRLGKDNEVSSKYSFGLGEENTIKQKDDDVTVPDYSLAFGRENYIYKKYDLGFGDYNIIDGEYSAGIGKSNAVHGLHSFAFGLGNIINHSYSLAFGLGNIINGSDSFVAGTNLETSANNQILFGKNNKKNLETLFAIGNGEGPEEAERANIFEIDINSNTNIGTNNIINGSHNFVVGNNLQVTGGYKTVFGKYNLNNGELFMIGAGESDDTRKNLLSLDASGAFKIGFLNSCIGNNCFVIGSNNTIDPFEGEGYSLYCSNSSILNGRGNHIKYNNSSFILGDENTIETKASTAENSTLVGLIGNNLSCIFETGLNRQGPTLIIGKYNSQGTDLYTNCAFAIGGGSSDNRKDIFSIDYDGQIWGNSSFWSNSSYPLLEKKGRLRHWLHANNNEAYWTLDDTVTGYQLWINKENKDGLYPTEIIFGAGVAENQDGQYGQTYASLRANAYKLSNGAILGASSYQGRAAISTPILSSSLLQVGKIDYSNWLIPLWKSTDLVENNQGEKVPVGEQKFVQIDLGDRYLSKQRILIFVNWHFVVPNNLTDGIFLEQYGQATILSPLNKQVCQYQRYVDLDIKRVSLNNAETLYVRISGTDMGYDEGFNPTTLLESIYLLNIM